MKVRCVSPFEPKLYKGTLYTVESITKEGFLRLKELPGDEWKASRFNPVKRNELDVTIYPVIKQAKTIEDVICLASLIAAGIFPPTADLEDKDNYFDQMLSGQCINCKLNKLCLANTINQ
jgi:hypothetical protein